VLRVIAGAIASAIIGAALLVGWPSPAGAQSYLTASSPKDGSRVDVAPSQVVMQFTQPILATGYRVVVLGPNHSIAYQALGAQIAGDKLTQPLKPLGAPGEYRVEFRVVAADEHPLTGELRFTLTKPGPAAGGANARPAPFVAAATSVDNARPWEWWTVGVLALLLVTGAVMFGWRVTRDLD
jgi:methionine-rich copper-binding protein CopC